MRAVALWIVGVAGLLVFAAAAFWLALPWLIGPPAPPSLLPSVSGGAFTPAGLLAAAHPGPGGTESLTLSTAQADALLSQWTGSPGAEAAGISAAVLAFTAAGIDLRVWGDAPSSLPLARLDGRPFELEARLSPRLVAPGVLDLSLTYLRLGRLPITGVVPPVAVMGALASLVHSPAASAAWWRFQGATLRLDLSKAPPIVVAPLQLHLVPTALAVSPDVLAVTLRPDAVVTLGAATLTQMLSQALLAQGGGVAPTLQFYPDSAEVTLVSGGAGGTPGVEHIELTVGVRQPGVLHIGVSGVSADGAAAVLVQAVGGMPPWLAVGTQGFDVDFSRIAPISVGSGVRLRLLPTAATLGPGGLLADVQVVPVAGG